VIARYLSCPAVSQICALIVFASTWIDRVANSTPMVDFESRLNSLRVNRLNRLDLPTPESPISTTAGGDCQYAGGIGEQANQRRGTFLPLKRNCRAEIISIRSYRMCDRRTYVVFVIRHDYWLYGVVVFSGSGFGPCNC
jgi:hypothetical protein